MRISIKLLRLLFNSLQSAVMKSVALTPPRCPFCDFVPPARSCRLYLSSMAWFSRIRRSPQYSKLPNPLRRRWRYPFPLHQPILVSYSYFFLCLQPSSSTAFGWLGISDFGVSQCGSVVLLPRKVSLFLFFDSSPAPPLLLRPPPFLPLPEFTPDPSQPFACSRNFPASPSRLHRHDYVDRFRYYPHP